jgi:LPS export ABC transporter permease LptG
LIATSGSLHEGGESRAPELELHQGSIHQLSEESLEKSKAQTDKPSSDKAGQDKKKAQTLQNYTVNRYQDLTIELPFSEETEVEAIGIRQDQQPAVAEMSWNSLMRHVPSEAEYRTWQAEIQERVAFPAACLVFAMLGVGFGISNVRTGRSFGLILGLGITIVYYLLALGGKHWAISGQVPPWLGIWMANIVLGAVGAVVLWIQRRPGSDALSALASLRHRLRPLAPTEPVAPEPMLEGGGGSPAATAEVSSSPRGGRGRRFGLPWGMPSDRSGTLDRRTQGGKVQSRAGANSFQPLLIDRLVLSDLVRFFFFILAGFSILFIIITLFQLLDQITRNKIEPIVVVNYLVFLMPMILNYMAPIAALVTVMITFGILEKTSQLVVLKASGLSIYRLAVPALLCSLLLSAFVFVNQDYVLPFTQRRQDNLYHLIRSGQEPAQTFFQMDHKWIFGGDSRIYNYAHFNPIENVFARLTVLSLSRDPFAIKSRLFARTAKWDGQAEAWVLTDGWERYFDGDKSVLETFKKRQVALPERPQYFTKESLESSMMTLAELRRHIQDLSRSGFDVLDLKIDLYRKIAFPLTCLVMLIVGLPFAFSVGKRGALYGVTIGIAIGLVYWGLLELFVQMGRYELLPPLVAAWGPNMMFGTGGLYLFLTSRT